ncbi:conserved Plasmodium protein, unknown function, partial [Plasmodium malariae]
KEEEEDKSKNNLLNNLINKKKRRVSSSSYLCSASHVSSSSASSSLSSTSSNSFVPYESHLYRTNLYFNKSNNEYDNYNSSNVLVNSRVPVESLLLRKTTSSCSDAYDDTNNNCTSNSIKVKRKWMKITTVGSKPNSRYGHSLDFLYPHLVLFGGNEKVGDEENFYCKNDLWVLNIENCKIKYKKKTKQNKTKNSKIFYFTWQEIEYKSISPLGRYFHSTSIWYDKKKKKNNLILYGGKVKNKTNSSRLFSLHKNGNNWYWNILPVYIDNLNENRAYHSIVCIRNYIFIIGGEEYTYKYIEKMPSALYSFETKKFQYINDFTAKACLKCFAKDDTIYTWGGFTDIPCNNENCFPNNFVLLDINLHILCIQMKDGLYDEYDEKSSLVIKADVDSDDNNIYNRINEKIQKIENKKIELEKDMLYQIKLNNNMSYRIKSQMIQYERLVHLLNVKQRQNSYLLNLLKRQSLHLINNNGNVSSNDINMYNDSNINAIINNSSLDSNIINYISHNNEEFFKIDINENVNENLMKLSNLHM